MTAPQVVLGRIGGLHGVRGELKLVSYTDPPRRILDYRPWLLQAPDGRTLEIERPRGRAQAAALLITLIGLLVVVYARYYISSEDPIPRFFSLLLAFMGAMLGIVLSGNLILLSIFWELTSLFSFLLIGYWHHNATARDGARMALTVTGIGGFCLLAGVLVNLGLFILVSLAIAGRPTVSLGFDLNGAPVEAGASARLLLLPVLSVLIYVADLIAGRHDQHRRGGVGQRRCTHRIHTGRARAQAVQQFAALAVGEPQVQ